MQEAVREREKTERFDRVRNLTEPDVMDMLEEFRVIASVRTSIFENVEDVTGAILAGGIRIVLISISVPQRFRFIETMTKRHENILVGACHVSSGEQAQKAIEAGAKFVTSVFLSKDMVNVCRNSNVLVAQGASTPTEIMEVAQSGADMVHLFPADFLGGPAYLRDIRDPLPNVKYLVTGGVKLDNVIEFLKAGATAAVVDDAIVDRGLIRENNWKEITERARLFTQKIASVKASK